MQIVTTVLLMVCFLNQVYAFYLLFRLSQAIEGRSQSLSIWITDLEQQQQKQLEALYIKLRSMESELRPMESELRSRVDNLEQLLEVLGQQVAGLDRRTIGS